MRVKYPVCVRTSLLEKAMKQCELDSHIKNMEFKRDAGTWAERIATRFYGKAGFPVKNSYMFCDSLDMCFFYDKDMVPTVTYAGYTQFLSKDTITLPQAFEKAKDVLNAMWHVMKDYEKETGHE